MALRALDDKEHSKLLQKIDELPFDEKQASQFRQQLDNFFEEYHTLLVSLAGVIDNYRQVAGQIRTKTTKK